MVCSMVFSTFYVSVILICSFGISYEALNIFKKPLDSLEIKYGSFPEDLRLQMLAEAKEMFYFGYNNYMQYAFPKDELNPLLCSGRGPDYDNPSNININDILGDYCLTLVDSLDTLAVLGNASEFQNAVTQVIQNVSFDKDNVVQVFEANIRVLGALISAHLLMMDPEKPFGDLTPPWYEGELLQLAHDLASRLLPAFEKSTTGIPYPRVNLRLGLPNSATAETCTAGAGSLVLEFGILSRLLGDPVYEGYARRASKVLWDLRAKSTGLLGNVIDAESGRWVGRLSGLGAGLDSFYEYLLKSYIMFGEHDDYEMFEEAYRGIKQYMRRGRPHCNQGSGDHPLYVNVDMTNGAIHTSWIDSLQAAFAGIQVLHGDVEEAICVHALYYSIWKRYGVLPERWNWQRLSADVVFYPLRPELVESTYLLYQWFSSREHHPESRRSLVQWHCIFQIWFNVLATKNPFYLHVGMDILKSLNNITKAECGYATVHNVLDGSLEDRMESFFLSETCKYLYLLFDKDNHVNRNFHKYMFSTEGHLFPIHSNFRSKAWEREKDIHVPSNHQDSELLQKGANLSCEAVNAERTYFLPIKSHYFIQISKTLGLENY